MTADLRSICSSAALSLLSGPLGQELPAQLLAPRSRGRADHCLRELGAGRGATEFGRLRPQGLGASLPVSLVGLRRWLGALGLLLICLLLPAASATASEALSPEESLTQVLFEGGATWRHYTRFERGDRAHYLFCGQGEVEVLSRGMVSGSGDLARYTLRVEVDGATPARELSYRAQAVPGARFQGDVQATSLRKRTLDLGRGCHTLRLDLARSTSSAVGVRLLWRPEGPTKRRWSDVAQVGGQPATLVSGGNRAAYRRLEGGEGLEVAVEGPGWVRLLARPVGQRDTVRYSLEIESDGRHHRSYLLDNRPSARSALAGRPGVAVGSANEVVFPVAAGPRRLTVRASSGLEVVLRAQVADRTRSTLPEHPRPGWSTRARLASYYDDNILRYSDKFVERFESGQDPGRFRVESLDDVIQRLDLYTDRRFAGLGGREARLGIDAEHRAYLRNSIKDWTRVGLSWDQDLGLGRELQVAASWAPGFYVRHLRDSDLRGTGVTGDDRFQPFEFDKADLRLRFGHPLGTSSDLRYHLGLASFRHNAAFREFDSENLYAGLRVDHRLTSIFRLSAAVELTESDARGWDEAGETRATSDDTDPSYRQLDLMVAGRWRFPGERRPTLFLQGEVGLREYTTDKPSTVAPLHVGRDDDLLRLYASWQIDLSKRYRLTAFAQHRQRSSSALVDLDIGLEKDYEQTELGLRLTALFD